MLNSITELINAYLSPYKRSGSYEVRPLECPFCHGGESHDQYTFSINIDSGRYYCFRGSCGASGSIHKLASHFGEEISDSTKYTSKATTQYQTPKTELLPITDQCVQYFESRGIHRDTLNGYGVSSDIHGNIVFPFTFSDELVYVKFRKPVKRTAQNKKDPKEWQESNCRPVLFGMDMCSFNQPLIITEGMIDALSIAECGITNVTSVPCGCENLKWIEEIWDWLERFDTFIIFGDNDTPGRGMVKTLCKRLGEARCKIIDEYPLKADGTECKDANEILCELGEIELTETIEKAKDIPVRGLLDLATVIPEDPSKIERIKTCIPALDESIGGLRMGSITVFTGRPGQGKSTLSGSLLLNGIEQGYNVAAYTGELSAGEFLEWINLQAAGSKYITLKYDNIKGKNIPYVPLDVQQKIMDWYRGKFFLYDNNEIFESNQAESILQVFTTAVRKHGCRLFLVDSLMCATSDTDEETKAQGKFANALKRFAIKYNVHIILISHPRKLAPGRNIIGQDDIAGNSATIRLAHSAVVVEKPNLRVIKSRDTGICRLIECCYCPDSHRIYQKDAGDMYSYSWDDGTVKEPTVKAIDYPEFGVQLAEPQTMI